MLFDLGDTLWSRGEAAVWERLENISNQRAVALLRERIDPTFLPMLDDPTFGRRLRQAIDHYLRTSIHRDPENEPDGALAVIATLHQWGIPEVDRNFGAEIFEALRIRIPESRPLFDDSLSTIIELHQRGFLLGIVTNRIWGGPPFLEDLRTLGLHQYFHPDAIAISGDLGRRKPAPEIFLHALNALDVSPAEAVMVGDSLSADVLGAQALGIFAIWKPKPYNRDYLDRYLRGDITPDLIIECLSDLLEIFQKVGIQ